MKIKTSNTVDFSPQELAQALAASTPREFAAFWFEFHNVTKEMDLMPFAVAMAPDLGANRMKPLHELVELINFVRIHDYRVKQGVSEMVPQEKEDES